jgi:hypothetical protein
MALTVSGRIRGSKLWVLVLHGRIAFEGPFAAPERLMLEVEDLRIWGAGINAIELKHRQMTLGFHGTERPVAEAEAEVESRASTGGRLSLALTPCAGNSQIPPERRWRAAARGCEARLMQPVAMPKLGTPLALPHTLLAFAGISLCELL